VSDTDRPVLWRGAELAAVLGLDPADVPDVRGVSLDSRTLAPNDLFVALSGAPDPRYRGAAGSGRDGHAFVADAARAGAAAALVARPTGAALAELRVDDPFDALWRLARAARDRFAGPVFAITGSSGKTTAKEMLAAGLGATAGGVHASAGSLNNHLGVPLSLARLPTDAPAAVFELGMNSPGEIAPLSHLVRPTLALVLNVLPVHLEGLGSLEAIRREKLSIGDGLGPEGRLLVHDTVDVHDRDPSRLVRFGTAPDADVRLAEGPPARVHLPDGTQLDIEGIATGPHRRLTAVAALGLIALAGLDAAPAVAAIRALAPPPGRGGIVHAGGVRLVDDAYNANPESVRQALAGLRELEGGRRFALLGDMLELGEEGAALHAQLADACAGLDGVFCVGPLARALHDALDAPLRAGWWPDCEALDLDAVLARLGDGDALLVKGSNRLFWKHDTVARLTAALDARTAPGS
jgi:UDP-N-acetylmuramoyl-tripeptide--D-alanyl-D-alanine ligase